MASNRTQIRNRHRRGSHQERRCCPTGPGRASRGMRRSRRPDSRCRRCTGRRCSWSSQSSSTRRSVLPDLRRTRRHRCTRRVDRGVWSGSHQSKSSSLARPVIGTVHCRNGDSLERPRCMSQRFRHRFHCCHRRRQRFHWCFRRRSTGSTRQNPGGQESLLYACGRLALPWKARTQARLCDPRGTVQARRTAGMKTGKDSDARMAFAVRSQRRASSGRPADAPVP